MQSPIFYSSLKETQLNVKEIYSLQVELSKRILTLKDKRTSNNTIAKEKNINTQFGEAEKIELVKPLKSIHDKESIFIDATRYEQDINYRKLHTSKNEESKLNKPINSKDGVNFEDDALNNKIKLKEDDVIKEADIEFFKNTNTIDAKLVLLVVFLIWEGLTLLAIFMIIF
jgi:hypothetical protein